MLLFVWFFAYHDHVTWQVVWVPLIAMVQYVFILGFTFMVSAITVFYRDVGIVIGHFMRLLFWISPILWSFMEVAGRGESLQAAMAGIDRCLGLPGHAVHGLISLNPTSLLMESYRKVLYGRLTWTRPPAAGLEASRPPGLRHVLAVILVVGVIITIIGTLIFKRLEPAFAKVL